MNCKEEHMSIYMKKQKLIKIQLSKTAQDLIARTQKDAKITPEFKNWVEKSLEEDKESLKALGNL